MSRAAFDMVALTPEQRAEALSSGNKYFTWLNLGRPKRDITEAEALEHYVVDLFRQHGAAAFDSERQVIKSTP
jgi:hypothetical protein